MGSFLVEGPVKTILWTYKVQRLKSQLEVPHFIFSKHNTKGKAATTPSGEVKVSLKRWQSF